MIRLKSCPFCGGKATLYEQKHREYPSTFYVYCKDCHIKQSGYKDKNSAIETWNNRKPIDDIIEQLSARADEANDRIDFEDTIEGKNYYDGKEDGLREAVEIVKGGGVDE